MSEDLHVKEETRRSFLKIMTGLGVSGLAGVTLGGLTMPAVVHAREIRSGGFGDAGYRHGEVVPIAPDNPSIVHNNRFCRPGNCDECIRVCREVQTVFDYWNPAVAQEIVCVNCGQCALVCPGRHGIPAIRERDETTLVFDALNSPDCHVVVQTAPATRVALGEEFGLPAGAWMAGQQVAALRALGFDSVLDTNFTADLTIMEEATEFLYRVNNTYPGKYPLPMFTSCCPGWVSFVEHFYPELIPNLSSCMSPQQMFGSLSKTYYAEQRGLDPKNIISVSIMPCTAKKYEAQRPEMDAASQYWDDQDVSRDVDVVLTTRELARMIKAKGIDFANLPAENYDSLMGEATGAGIIFGATGGVMEAALRTAYFTLTGDQPTGALLNYTPVRGLDGVKQASVTVTGVDINMVVVHELKNARAVCDRIMAGNPDNWHFIEFMACSGGCVSGGGQPRTAVPPTDAIRQARTDTLYAQDADAPLRSSHENPEILAIYESFLEKPCGDLSHRLLHTDYTNRGPVF